MGGERYQAFGNYSELFTNEGLPLLSNPSEREQTIFDYYNVENEAVFVQHIPEEQRGFYRREQIRNFLAEFVFQAPKQEIVYFQGKDGKFYAKGVPYPVEKSYRKAVEAEDSILQRRYAAEYEGFLKLQEAFGQGYNLAFWFSPPTFGAEGFGNYSFVFVLVKDGDRVVEHIIRLEGENENFQKVAEALQEVLVAVESPQISQSIEQIDFPYYFAARSENDFLANPLALQVDNPRKFLQLLSFTKDLGILSEREAWLEEFVSKDRLFAEFFGKYQSAIEKRDISQAKLALIAIYNRARKFVKVKGSNGKVEFEQYPEESIPSIFFYYASQGTEVSAGSCPVGVSQGPQALLTSAFPGGLLNFSGGRIDYFIADLLTGGGERVLKCVTCPECGEVVDAAIKDGEIRCPECGAREKLR